MAVGPFARIAAQVIVPILAVMARALPAAYAQALQNARKAGVNASTEAAAPVFGKRITRSEALQVLNITEQEITADPKIIEKVRVFVCAAVPSCVCLGGRLLPEDGVFA